MRDVCARCKPDMHTCVAPLSRGGRVAGERERGGGGGGHGGGRGRGRESKQNLHGNSVPVGRVELWVFNALLSAPLPSSQPPTLYPHLQPVPRTPSLSFSSSLSLSSSPHLSPLPQPVCRFVSFPSLPLNVYHWETALFKQ